MGGSLLCDKEKPIRPIFIDPDEELDEFIEVPDMTEEEIQGKSKSDLLAKSPAFLQTSWFIIQCIVRGV